MCIVDRVSFLKDILLMVALHYLLYNMEILHDMFLLQAALENLFLKYEAEMVYYGLHIVH